MFVLSSNIKQRGIISLWWKALWKYMVEGVVEMWDCLSFENRPIVACLEINTNLLCCRYSTTSRCLLMFFSLFNSSESY